MKNTLLPLDEFLTRRQSFFAKMPEYSIAIFSAANESTRSNDTEYPFCQDKNFYYLTGFNEPDALLVLVKDETCQAIIFCREKDPFQEIWHGRRIGQVKAVENYGFDQAFNENEAAEKLPEFIQNKSALLFCFGDNSTLEQNISTWMLKVKQQSRQGFKAPQTVIDASAMINEMRLIKSTNELNVMREVNIISSKAHQRAMEKTKAGLFEYQIEAELIHEMAQHGARHVAYNSIVAGGDNANILHYTDNNERLNDNDLLLIDAGGELAGYAADITRTFPVNGKFSIEQKAIYQLVLNAQIAAIEAIKPGINFAQLNQLVTNMLTEGLFDLSILKGDLAQLIDDKASKKYFIHGLGHWLGLDVHDVGDYQVNENKAQLRAFAEGMVLTIEPGIYIPINDSSVESKWRGIGIRIEDNIAVTEQGYENLTVNAPKSIASIESLMA